MLQPTTEQQPLIATMVAQNKMSGNSRLKSDAKAIWTAGVAGADAQKLTLQAIRLDGHQLKIGSTSVNFDEIDRIVVVGGGKASCWMACGLLDALGPEWIDRKKVSGWINAPEDQVIDCGPINIFGARPTAENLPTEAVLVGTDRILELVGGLDQNDLCVCLISGGGSALLEKPVAPVSLSDIRDLTKVCSANKTIDIKQLNTVRKKLSQIKGGGLAISAYPAKVVSLILSDIIGDPIDLIASGPTVRDTQTVNDAIEVVSRLSLDRNRFSTIWNVLDCLNTQSPKPLWPASFCVDNHIIGNNRTAIEYARLKATELGYETRVGFADPGDDRTANETGRELAAEIRSLAGTRTPICLISGGEPTVELCSAPGRGGRNQQLVLAALLELVHNQPAEGVKYCVLSGGTDGEDGNVAVAGAAIDSATVAAVIDSDLVDWAKTALANNDSFSCLNTLNATLETNRTKTNVCDLRVAVVST